jgi:tetratricopeptide (TPR) repeat protein/transcriptional regulator with XRE-family HTH domain
MGADQAGRCSGFGGLLRWHRLAAGLSQEELAERSGLSSRAIADMERGRTTRPYRRSVRSLADALALKEPERKQLERASRPAPPGSAPALTAPSPEPERMQAMRVMRQLPAAVSSFTGREAELTALTRLLESEPDAQAPAVVISAIGGTAGVGKTALAIQWAHQTADRFPDGQLYVNLRGYDPDQPVKPGDALAGFLRALGVPGQEIPDETEERSGVYRSRLAGRRILVVLDNARDGAQVRPLLPGDPGCVAVVTSRDSLAGLVAADGARRLDLDVLPLADAVTLLRSLIGPRAENNPDAADELAELCARLPLALRIAAELAATRPEASLRELAAELRGSRLDLLDAGEDRADVRAVFSWSYGQLPSDVGEAFALTGLHPGVDFDFYAAAALTGNTLEQARRIVARLRGASLLQAAGSDRFGLHDLLRSYAREQAAASDTDSWCRQALTRLFDYYLTAAAAAMDILFPAEAHLRPLAAVTTAAIPDMPSEADARAWLDSERANLVVVVVHCTNHGWPGHATDLATTLSRYLIDGSHVPQGQTIYDHALQAARQSGDLVAEADALSNLAGVSFIRGHVRESIGPYMAALERYRQCGIRSSEAETLHNLGAAQYQLHDCPAAVAYFRESVTAWQDAGDSLGVARALTLLAGAEIRMDQHDDAAEHLQLALPVLREAKDQTFEASALGWLGGLTSRRGRLAAAVAFHEQALAIYRRIDHPSGTCRELNNLGEINLRREEYRQAIGYLEQALDLCREAGNLEEIMTLRMLAEALHGIGQPAAARAKLEAALGLAAETGDTYEHACVHRDLAENDFAADEETRARQHWLEALDLYTQLGAPEADQIRSRLGDVAITTLD